jgi:hypothetical protein
MENKNTQGVENSFTQCMENKNTHHSENIFTHSVILKFQLLLLF